MFAGVWFTQLRAGSTLRAAARRMRATRAAPAVQTRTNVHGSDDACKLPEFFATSAFLDFGGVPTELLAWYEAQTPPRRGD